MKRKSRKLKDIEAEEISLVGDPANRRRFYFLKAAAGELNTILEDFFGSALFKAELEDVELRDLPPESVKALKSALKILAQYKDDYPDEVLRAISTLSKFALGEDEGAADNYGKKYPKKPKGDEDEEGDEEEERKALKRRALERAGLRPSTTLAGQHLEKSAPFHWSSLSGDPDLEDDDESIEEDPERPISKALTELDEIDGGQEAPKTDAELWPSLCGE